MLDAGNEEESGEPAAQEAVVPGQGGSASQGVYGDLPAGFTEEGFPYRGDPGAPIVLEEFSDYLCPFCGRHFTETLPTLVENFVADGQVQYVFRDLPLVSLHPNAPVGHKAAICAGQQGAEFYWQHARRAVRQAKRVGQRARPAGLCDLGCGEMPGWTWMLSRPA